MAARTGGWLHPAPPRAKLVSGYRQGHGRGVVLELPASLLKHHGVNLTNRVGGGAALGSRGRLDDTLHAQPGLALASLHYPVRDHHEPIAGMKHSGALRGSRPRAPTQAVAFRGSQVFDLLVVTNHRW